MSLYKNLINNPEYCRIYAGESHAMNILEEISDLMNDTNTSYRELSEKMKISEERVKEIFRAESPTLQEVGQIIHILKEKKNSL